jgi:hypothetical protein
MPHPCLDQTYCRLFRLCAPPTARRPVSTTTKPMTKLPHVAAMFAMGIALGASFNMHTTLYIHNMSSLATCW